MIDKKTAYEMVEALSEDDGIGISTLGEYGEEVANILYVDLLESRELIKEMREQLSAVVSTASTPTTKGELVYVNNYIEMRELIEKSKDYA